MLSNLFLRPPRIATESVMTICTTSFSVYSWSTFACKISLFRHLNSSQLSLMKLYGFACEIYLKFVFQLYMSLQMHCLYKTIWSGSTTLKLNKKSYIYADINEVKLRYSGLRIVLRSNICITNLNLPGQTPHTKTYALIDIQRRKTDARSSMKRTRTSQIPGFADIWNWVCGFVVW